MYRSAPGDAAFTLLGPVPDVPTPTDTPTETPTDVVIDTPTDTPTATPTDTPTNSPTDTPTSIPTNTPTATPTDTPTSTPTDTPTPTNTPTFTPTSTPTPTPLFNTPGKVTGGGSIGSQKESIHATFGLIVDYTEGNSAPKGNFTYQDHTNNMRLKATSINLLIIEGNHAWFTGTGTLNDGQTVLFTVNLDTSGESDMFSISIPLLNGYTVSDHLSGGNITIR